MAAEFFCLRCRTPFLNSAPLDENGVCRLCRSGVHGFDAVYCYGEYTGALRELIHLFKYSGMRPLAEPLGRLMSRALPRDQRFDALVPMPMHWRKWLARGFNQSTLLARVMSRRTGLPLWKVVRREKGGAPQAGLTHAQRLRNTSGAFHVPRPERVRGKRLLLIDDVYTTGATAGACALALRRAGAAHVAVLALARPDRQAALRAGKGVGPVDPTMEDAHACQ
jgi:ComF family protein